MSYNLSLALPPGTMYFGICTCSFELTDLPTKPLWLDFRGLKIANFSLNGELDNQEDLFKDHKIFLCKESLKIGTNIIKMAIQNMYRNDGDGIHSFIDPEDGEQYIYTMCEPDMCHWFIPVFD